jgi:hypothetical protein
MLRNSADKKADSTNTIRLRQYPYPYRAMLAICSDLDETPDWHTFWEIMRFLNTTETTAMGPGVGLEVGNSIYFDMPPEQFAYFNTSDEGREMIRRLIKSGHVDCLHSFGDLAATRRHAARALEELDRYDCRLKVWVDHGTAPTNFGPDIMQGHGDETGHQAYHADLTIDYGIEYISRGRVTSITGQDIHAQLSGIFSVNHPIASSGTLLKEIAKRTLARAGSKKYKIHGPNEVLYPVTLRDGREVYEFMRCNPHWGGVSSCEQGRHIDKVLTSAMINRLIERGGTCVLYTHLGKIDNPDIPFGKAAVEGFRGLAEAFQSGSILVTTTRRLLNYRRAVREVIYTSRWDDGNLCIDVDTRTSSILNRELSAGDLSGLTFYVPDAEKISIKVNGQIVPDLKFNPADNTGQSSVSLIWPRLEFPKL